MKREDYNSFFEEVIVGIITDIEQLSEQLMGDKNVLKRKKEKKYKEQIYKFYQKKRDYIRSNYMTKEYYAALDRHKVASCMLFAILKAKPFQIDRTKKLDERLLLANEYLAFYAALNIIENYRISVNGMNETDCQILLPETYQEKAGSTDYLSNICRNLYFLSIYNIEKYDVLAYSNILYMLEKYTDISIEKILS